MFGIVRYVSHLDRHAAPDGLKFLGRLALEFGGFVLYTVGTVS